MFCVTLCSECRSLLKALCSESTAGRSYANHGADHLNGAHLSLYHFESFLFCLLKKPFHFRV